MEAKGDFYVHNLSPTLGNPNLSAFPGTDELLSGFFGCPLIAESQINQGKSKLSLSQFKNLDDQLVCDDFRSQTFLRGLLLSQSVHRKSERSLCDLERRYELSRA